MGCVEHTIHAPVARHRLHRTVEGNRAAWCWLRMVVSVTMHANLDRMSLYIHILSGVHTRARAHTYHTGHGDGGRTVYHEACTLHSTHYALHRESING